MIELVPLSQEHAAGLASGLDEVIWRLWPIPMRTIDDVRAYIDGPLHAPRAEAYCMLVDGEPAGATTIYNIDETHRQATIGWTFIRPAHRRTALNTTVKLRLLTRCFEELGLIRVQFDIDGRNTRSQDAVRRLGATHEGTLRKHKVLHDGFVRDTTVWSILADEWPDIKQRLTARSQ